ncbi:MAG: substrate-binding domain-containing protein [Nitrososphaerota archaeon]|jgi:molybdate/tungstate transport system substrate-binding protein|nr:substrate-binding domain-containing protein [Nitrososphaerota archaeon]MDG6947535.1 substrate-binding domain-containing protein [Nitrososphaerota archaeon]
MSNAEKRRYSNIVLALIVVAVVVVGGVAYAYYVNSGPRSPLLSYSADAYATETTDLLNSFSHSTGIPVAPVKSGGSFAIASQIAAGSPADIFVSVALSATGPEYLKSESPGWAVGFASDQLVLAYSNTSVPAVVAEGNGAAQTNTTSGWNAFFTSLTSGSVKVGISDPVSDPAGLRGWLALEAAGYLYSGGNTSAYSSRLAEDGGNVTGASAAALVAPLQSGQIQFLFIYKSAAITDHLRYVQLEPQVNFGNPSLGAFYSRFSFNDSAGTTVGSAIVLSVTVPLDGSQQASALKFVKYVVENAQSLSSYGLLPLVPAQLYSNVTPPGPIAQMVSQGLLKDSGPLP